MSTAVLVLGMHRSGTSALAGALARLGVALGDRVDDSAEDTAVGYYEHEAVVTAHDAHALRAGRTWDDPRPAGLDLHREEGCSDLQAALRGSVLRELRGEPLWAVKDPRLCRVVPAWLDLLDAEGIAAHCLLILRAPAEVAASLASRDGFSAEKSAALWLDHVLAAERASRGRNRSCLRFEELLADPPGTLARCANELGVGWPTPPRDAGPALTDFLGAGRRHHHDTPWGESAGALARLAEEVWHGITSTSSWPGDGRIDGWYQAYVGHFGPESALAYEHATQVAQRTARDRAWASEGALRQELADTLARSASQLGEVEAGLRRELADTVSGAEARVGDVVDGLARELAAHSRELVTQGEALTQLGRQLERIERSPVKMLGAKLRRLLRRK